MTHLLEVIKKGLAHQPLSAEERMLYHYAWTVGFFLVTFLVTNVFDLLVVQGYGFDNPVFWKVNIPTLCYAVISIVLTTWKKYLSVQGDVKAGFMVSTLLQAEEALAHGHGIVIPEVVTPSPEGQQESEKPHGE